MKAYYEKRFKRLCNEGEQEGLDAILINNPVNSFYLTGVPEPAYPSGRCSLIINVKSKEGFLVVPSLEVNEVEDRIKNDRVEIIEYKVGEKSLDKVVHLLQKMKVKRVGIEEDYTTKKQLEDITAKVSVAFKPMDKIMRNLRMIKDDAEIRAIMNAIKLTEQALKSLTSYIKEGITEAEIAAKLAKEIFSEGGKLAFDIIVASGPRGAYPHGYYSLKKLRAGEPIVIDVGARVQGYCADITRVFIIGNIRKEVKEYISAIEEAIDKGIEFVKEGIHGSKIDNIVREVLRTKGLGEYFTHSTGHGVGIEVHEGPMLGPLSKDVLKTGMVTTIEPGIYFKDKYGIRIEEMVLVEKDKCKVMTSSLTRVFEI